MTFWTNHELHGIDHLLWGEHKLQHVLIVYPIHQATTVTHQEAQNKKLSNEQLLVPIKDGNSNSYEYVDLDYAWSLAGQTCNQKMLTKEMGQMDPTGRKLPKGHF